MSMQVLFLNGRHFEWHSTKQMPNINQTFYLFIYSHLNCSLKLNLGEGGSIYVVNNLIFDTLS